MKVAVALSLALLAWPAYAKPVYLTCSTTYRGDAERTFSVTVDEETGKVTHQFSNGSTFNADGLFTSTEVSYKSVHCGSTCMTQQFTVNRVDLSVKTSIVISARNVGESAPIISNGQCTLQDAPARQF
jgi:hypothetical protein